MKKISGVGKRHILRNFFRRINTPYNLYIRNAVNGEEMLHLGLTKKSVYFLLSTFLVLSFFVVSLLFLFTPIKYYIPGYETDESRQKIIALETQIDELESYQKNTKQKMENLFAVATGREDILHDTVMLSTAQLSSADNANEKMIETDAGKERIIGKMPVDSTKIIDAKKSKNDLEKVAEISEAPVPEKPKKRDTIITYR